MYSIDQFVIDSERTLSDNFNFKDRKSINLLHGCIGLLTEIWELKQAMPKLKEDPVNFAEEIADAMWYVAIFHRELSIDIDRNLQKSITQSVRETAFGLLDIRSNQLLDMFKKGAFYSGKSLDEKAVIALVKDIDTALHALILKTPFTMEEALDKNIRKLKARYPEKFTAERAEHRDLAKEREQLES